MANGQRLIANLILSEDLPRSAKKNLILGEDLPRSMKNACAG
jgi:hypothetical protein